jgi:hypothetical protein
MSSESTFVVNVKTKNGTIITVRGDDYAKLQQNITDAVVGNIDNVVGSLEELFANSAQANIQYATAALGATQVTVAQGPVAPPSQSAQPSPVAPTCKHGSMVYRVAQKGPRAGKGFWGCTAPMNAPDKCAIINA